MADARELWPVIKDLKIVGIKTERDKTSILLDDGTILVCKLVWWGEYEDVEFELDTYLEPPAKPVSGWYTSMPGLIAEDDDVSKHQ